MPMLQLITDAGLQMTHYTDLISLSHVNQKLTDLVNYTTNASIPSGIHFIITHYYNVPSQRLCLLLGVSIF